MNTQRDVRASTWLARDAAGVTHTLQVRTPVFRHQLASGEWTAWLEEPAKITLGGTHVNPLDDGTLEVQSTPPLRLTRI
jgi:hypothetical protein